jgi:hypothetical protein
VDLDHRRLQRLIHLGGRHRARHRDDPLRQRLVDQRREGAWREDDRDTRGCRPANIVARAHRADPNGDAIGNECPRSAMDVGGTRRQLDDGGTRRHPTTSRRERDTSRGVADDGDGALPRHAIRDPEMRGVRQTVLRAAGGSVGCCRPDHPRGDNTAKTDGQQATTVNPPPPAPIRPCPQARS